MASKNYRGRIWGVCVKEGSITRFIMYLGPFSGLWLLEETSIGAELGVEGARHLPSEPAQDALVSKVATPQQSEDPEASATAP